MAAQNLFQSYLQPVRSVTDYEGDLQAQDMRRLQIQGAERNNAMAALAQRQQMQGMQRNALVQAAQRAAAEQAAGDESAYARNLRLSGFPELIDPADKVDKAATERGKAKSENAKRDTETENNVIAMWRDMIGNAVDQQQAAQMFTAMRSDPRIANTPVAQVPLELGLRSLAEKPLDQWKKEFALGATKYVEMNKPTYQQQNLGGTMQTLALPGLGGAPTVAAAAPITQSADNAATQATALANQRRMSADAAAGRAQSAAQFNQRLSYDREKDKTTAAGGGNITEGERNAGGYAARMVEATKLLDKFEGTGRSTYATQAAGGIPMVGRALQTKTMNADQQLYRQAQEDWVRAKLRKESGAAIGVDEMANEITTYFPEPGDRPQVVEQKRQARAVANQAMVQSAGRGAPKSAAAPAPGSVLRFDAQGNPVP
jgi:hypothetical protein